MSDLNLANLDDDIAYESIRKGFGRGLLEAAKINDQVVALCADLTGSTQISLFAEAFPERFVEVGIAEQNLAGIGSGMAAMGKIPFIASYAAFSPGRNWEQIKTTIALNERPVKIVGAHAGLYTGPDGATHQMLEDIALMRVMPNMVVIVPGDSLEAERATIALAADSVRPGYIRLARDNTAILTTEHTPFKIGKAYVYVPGSDVTIITTGTLTYHALLAAKKLKHDGISAEVIHVPTIKPLDHKTIIESIQKTGAVVTAEEGQIAGGLGGAIAELIAEEFPVPLKRIGMQDRYGESGTPDELFEYFGIDEKHIRLAAHSVIFKKA